MAGDGAGRRLVPAAQIRGLSQSCGHFGGDRSLLATTLRVSTLVTDSDSYSFTLFVSGQFVR